MNVPHLHQSEISVMCTRGKIPATVRATLTHGDRNRHRHRHPRAVTTYTQAHHHHYPLLCTTVVDRLTSVSASSAEESSTSR